MGQFVLGRGVQGLGAGLVMVAIYVVIAEVYPPDLRPRRWPRLRRLGRPHADRPGSIRPVDAAPSWRAVFFVIVPLAFLGLALLRRRCAVCEAGGRRAARAG